jgi:hypothetical protein
MARIWQHFSAAICALALALSATAQTNSAVPATAGKRPAAKLARKKPAAKPAVEQPPPPPPTPEQMAPNPPQVRFQQGQLTIVANNSTLGDVLNAVRAQTGASIELPAGFGGERVMARLGPGPAADILASLLHGSKLNYIILGDSANPSAIRTVVLTPGSPAPAGGPAVAGASMQRPGLRPVQPTQPPEYEEPEMAQPEEQVTEIPDEAQPAPQQPPANQVPGQPTAQQPAVQQPDSSPTPDQQPAVKTPEQLLQELRKLKERERNPEAYPQQDEQ